MAAPIFAGLELMERFAEILGVDKTMVRDITLFMDLEGLPYARAEMLVSAEQAAEIEKSVREHRSDIAVAVVGTLPKECS